MAEDPKKDAPSDIEVKKSKEGKLILVVAILAVLVIILTPAITIVVLNSFNPEDKQAEVVTKEEDAKHTFDEVKLPTAKCNVSGTKGTRIILFQVTLKVDIAPKDKPDLSLVRLFEATKAGDASATGEVNLLSQANAKILEIMGNLTMDELDTPNAKPRIAVLITKALNELKHKQAPNFYGSVQDSYFEEFLIQ